MAEGQPVVDYEELRKIGIEAAHQVFPHKTRGLVGAIRDGCFPDIAARVCQFTPEEQSRFLTRSLGPQGANFHNSEAVVSYLVRLSNIRAQTTTVSTSDIYKGVNSLLTASDLQPLEIIQTTDQYIQLDRDYPNPLQAIRKTLNHTLEDSDRFNESWIVESMAYASLKLNRELPYYTRSYLRQSLELASRLLVVSDLIEDSAKTAALLEPVIQLAEMGVCVLGPVKTRKWAFFNQERIAVYIPKAA